jgi:ribosomal protein L15
MSKRTKGFEGGQMPLIRRLPKRGFTNKFAVKDQVVNIGSLNIFKEGEKVTAALLKEKNLIKDAESGVKVLGTGELKKNIEVHAEAFSKSAKESIEKAGGKAVLLREAKVRHIVLKKPGKTIRPQAAKEQKPAKEQKKQAAPGEAKPVKEDKGQKQPRQGQQPKQEYKPNPKEK